MKFYFSSIILIISFINGWCDTNSQNATAQKNSTNFNSSVLTPQKSLQVILTPSQTKKMNDWLTYRDINGKFEFKYPPNFKVEQNGETVRVFHQIKFKHQSPCEPQINADEEPDEYEGKKLDYLIDFDVSFKIVNGNIKDAFIAGEFDEDYAVKTAKDLDKFYKESNFLSENGKLNSEAVKKIEYDRSSGGCGSFVYAVPINPQNSLLVKRTFITLLNVSSTYYMDVPIWEKYNKRYKKEKDLINPEKEEKIFQTILSTWQKL